MNTLHNDWLWIDGESQQKHLLHPLCSLQHCWTFPAASLICTINGGECHAVFGPSDHQLCPIHILLRICRESQCCTSTATAFSYGQDVPGERIGSVLAPLIAIRIHEHLRTASSSFANSIFLSNNNNNNYKPKECSHFHPSRRKDAFYLALILLFVCMWVFCACPLIFRSWKSNEKLVVCEKLNK